MANKRSDTERLEQVMTLSHHLIENGINRCDEVFVEFSKYANIYLKENKNQDAVITCLKDHKITLILSTSRNVDCSIRIHRNRR